MVRIMPLKKHEAREEARSQIQAADDVFGVQSFSAGIQAYCPPILNASRALGAAPGQSDQLSAELRHLVCMRAAQIVTCPFWIDSNAAGSSKSGSSDEKIAAVGAWRTSNLFSREEKAAFELAEAMSQTPANIPEDVFSELKKYFRNEQIVELVATVAMENYRARFNRAFLIKPQGLYEPKT